MNHTLIITLTNGTSPNQYWLDYLNYTGSPLVSSSSIPTSRGVPIPSQSISVSNTSSSRTKVGPIIGSALGGTVLLIAFASFLFIYLKKHDTNYERPSPQIEQIPGEFLSSYSIQSSLNLCEGITPFPARKTRALLSGRQDTSSSTDTPDIKPSSTSSHSHSRPHITSLLISAPQLNQPVSTSVSPTTEIRRSTDATRCSSTSPRTTEHRPLSAEAEARAKPAPTPVLPQQGTSNQVVPPSSEPIMQQHVDSGFRIPHTVVEIPPPYSEI